MAPAWLIRDESIVPNLTTRSGSALMYSNAISKLKLKGRKYFTHFSSGIDLSQFKHNEQQYHKFPR